MQLNIGQAFNAAFVSLTYISLLPMKPNLKACSLKQKVKPI
jgi:hypothetical protein